MALPPSIPTSFVPHSASAAAHRFRADLTSIFDLFAYAVLGVVFVGALGVFFYGRILATTQFSKDAALVKVEAGIDLATVEEFVRLRDRLASAATLLDGHTALSTFFTTLGTLLPTSVRFSSLHLSVDTAGAVRLPGGGGAESLKAPAVVPTAP